MASTSTAPPADLEAAAPPESKKAGFGPSLKRAFMRFPPAIFPLIALFFLWQWGSTLPALTGTLPSATATLSEFWRQLFEPLTWQAVFDTLRMALIGFVLGVVVAVPLGLALGLSRFTFLSSRFTLNFLRVIPGIVVVPIATLVLGPTMEMGIFVVAWPITFVMAVQTAYGVRDADPVLIETLKCYRQGLWGQIRYARLPAAAPLIAYGLRISIIISFLAAVVAGIIGGAPGMGREMMYAQLYGESAVTFAIVLQLGLLGMLVSFFVEWAQPKLIFWIPS